MNAKHDQRPTHQTGLRTGLLLLAATPLGIGFWALLLPRLFYDDFPLPGRDWISTLGPYHEHLIVDYGAMNLGFCVLLVAAAIFLERRLVQVALITWLTFEVPHFVYHLMQVRHFSLGGNLAQLGSLGFLVLLPLVLLFFVVEKGSTFELRKPGSTQAR